MGKKPPLKWRCDACGDAENCVASCTVEVFAGEPECCPINGEDAEWYIVAVEQARTGQDKIK